MRAWLATAALAATLLVGHAPGALADADLDSTGWWWRAQTGLLTPLPPPPGVPDDGLVVSGVPDGPAAVAALRFHVDGEPLAATLALDVALDQGGAAAAIDACRTAHRWRPVRAGTWDSRPETECEARSVAGAASDDGQRWFFDVTELIQDGILDIVLEPPGGAPFQIAFEPPDSSSLEVTTSSEPVVFDAPVADEVTPPPADPPPDTFPAPAPQQAAPFTPDVVLPDAPEAAAPGPLPAPGAVSAAPPEDAPAASAAGEPVSDHAPSLGIALLLLAVGGVYVLARQQAPPVLGLGRFARPRAGPPPPLR